MFDKEELLPMLDPKLMKPALNPILVVDGAGLDQVKKYLDTHDEYSWDLETNVVPSFYQRKIRTFMLGDADQQFIIDMLAFADGDSNKLWAGQGNYLKPGELRKWHVDYVETDKLTWDDPEIPEYEEVGDGTFELVKVNPNQFKSVIDVVRPSLESDAWLKIGYNLEFEYVQTKWNLGIRSWHFYDLFLGERSLHNGRVNPLISGFWALDDLIARTFKARISKEYQTKFNLKDPLTTEHIEYGAMDIRLPWKLKQVQEPQIKKAQLAWSFQIENDAVPAFGDMHMNGLWVDPDKWLKIHNDNKAELAKEAEILDSHMIPFTGRKVEPNPALVEEARQAYKAFDEKTEEEKDLAKQIRSAKKDPALFAELSADRDALQAQRKADKEAAKAHFDSIKYLETKGYEKEFKKMAGMAAINYNSPQQVKAVFFQAHPEELSEKTLKNLDAKKTLIKFMHLPIVSAYVAVKKREKLLSSYGYRWITPRNQIAPETAKKKGFVDPDTGRIHPPFRQFGTETGRPSCSDPNVLNLPKEARYREAFTARPGYKCVTKDCSGQELRILTEISREQAWIDAFNSDKDVHSISAALIQPTQWKAAAAPGCAYYKDNQFKKCKCPGHDKIRSRFKAVNFGIAYDKQAASLSTELNISYDEAEAILTQWKETFSTTQAALENLREEAYSNGEARSLAGRRRWLIKVTMKKVIEKLTEKYGEGKWTEWQKQKQIESMVAAVKREGGNMPIQSTGAEMMKMAIGCGFDPDGEPFLWHTAEPLYEALLENYPYDELMYETPDEHCDAVGGPEGVGGLVSDAIIRAGAMFVTVVPMASEGAIAQTWTK